MSQRQCAQDPPVEEVILWETTESATLKNSDSWNGEEQLYNHVAQDTLYHLETDETEQHFDEVHLDHVWVHDILRNEKDYIHDNVVGDIRGLRLT